MLPGEEAEGERQRRVFDRKRLTRLIQPPVLVLVDPLATAQPQIFRPFVRGDGQVPHIGIGGALRRSLGAGDQPHIGCADDPGRGARFETGVHQSARGRQT